MADEDILKRLAEIEGLSWNNRNQRPAFPGAVMSDVTVREKFNPHWNPLTNWSDLGPLIEKHIGLIQKLDAYEYGDPEEEWRVCLVDRSYGPSYKSLPHAVCMAIIEGYHE